MSKKKIGFMCTAFRDGFQSAFGARVLTKDFLPAVKAAHDAGIRHFEAGGGARFQSLYFYCNEDAFKMMDSFRETTGSDANLQTLARGTNVVGLESQPRDIISLHARLFKKHGITTIRNFDALNDINNLIYSGTAIVEAGLKHQICVTTMELPPGCTGAHGPDFYMETLQKILDADIPFDSVCFKDASGTSTPAKVNTTIKLARKLLPADTIIHFHTHETAGIGIACNLAALDGGADMIDLSLAPCSGGTCQPDILTMWHALRGSEYDLDIDIDKIREAEDVFKECMKDYFTPPEAKAVEPLIPWSPMPGGALTANTQMLRDNNIMDKFPEIIKAMSEVVRRGGFGTSVTPVSQFYFQQAFNNVMFGPWKRIAEGYGKMVLGYYGKTPVPPDPEIVKLAIKELELEPTERPPVDINDENPEKGIEPAKKRLKEESINETDENIFIVATCGDKGIAFLKGNAKLGIRKLSKQETTTASSTVSQDKQHSYTVRVNNKKYSMTIENNKVLLNGNVYQADILPSEDSEPAPSATTTTINTRMPGQVIKIVAEKGTSVKAGDPVIIIEAMKMEIEVVAQTSGTIHAIMVKKGDHLQEGQAVAILQ
ncbi:MAG: biotin attachment protein [Kiritimatiellae bacterium]|nr:biotin attachment protein [Kiritimatiellia bacterium]